MSKRWKWARFGVSMAAALSVCGLLIWKPDIGAPIAVLLIGSGALVIAATGKPTGRPFTLSLMLLYRLPEKSFRAVVACMGLVILAVGLWGLVAALA